MVPDTGGPGRRRGAPSAELEFVSVGAEFELMYLSDGTLNPPLGARGGGAGGAAWQGVGPGGADVAEVDLCARLQIRPGDLIVSRCNGGGGYGSPLEREPERVRDDVGEGYVTIGHARDVYGVVVGEDGALDRAATRELRAARAAARKA